MWSRGCVAFDRFGGFGGSGGSGGFLPAAMTADIGRWQETGLATRPSRPLTVLTVLAVLAVLTVLAVLVWRHTPPPRPHPPFAAS